MSTNSEDNRKRILSSDSGSDIENKLNKNPTKLKKMGNDDAKTQNALDEILSTMKEFKSRQDESILLLKRVVDRMDKVETSVEHVQQKMNEIEQNLLMPWFRLSGFPAGKIEDPFVAVKAFAQNLNIELKREDFRKIYAQQFRNGKGSHIVGHLYSLQKKDQLMSAYKNLKGQRAILLKDVVKLSTNENGKYKDTKITIRNMLSTGTRFLLSEARKHSEMFDYIWESDGNVIMKKDNKIFTVKSSSDISKAVESQKSVALDISMASNK
jgi:hypothetical protein